MWVISVVLVPIRAPRQTRLGNRCRSGCVELDMTTLRTASAALVLFALAACSGSANPLVDPSAPTDGLLLRVETVGAFVPVEYSLQQMPSFSLYGDGRVIMQGAQIEIYPQPALPPVNVRTITHEGVEAIMQAARDAGLSGPDKNYDTMNVTDVGTTVFTVRDGEEHETKVYALGFDDGQNMSAEEKQARARLNEFNQKLSDLQSWLPEGSVGDEEAFEAESLRVYVRPFDKNAVEEGLEQKPRDWPLTDQPLATFGEQREVARCGVLDGHDAQTVLDDAAETNQLTPWVSDGKRYVLTFRPLLPDESGC